jgi:hypothetical protein
VASLRAGAGCFCLPFVATLPNTVLFPSTLAVDGAPPHPALPDIALYLRRLRERVAVWCVGGSQRCRTPAAWPRNRWDWNLPPLCLPAHPQAHRGPPRDRLLLIVELHVRVVVRGREVEVRASVVVSSACI